MPVYVQLVNWTERGAAAAKQTVQRARRVESQAKKLKIRVREIIWTMGRYDAVAIFEAPNDEAANRFALWVSTQGAARTETLRGYTAGEFAKIVAGL